MSWYDEYKVVLDTPAFRVLEFREWNQYHTTLFKPPEAGHESWIAGFAKVQSLITCCLENTKGSTAAGKDSTRVPALGRRRDCCFFCGALPAGPRIARTARRNLVRDASCLFRKLSSGVLKAVFGQHLKIRLETKPGSPRSSERARKLREFSMLGASASGRPRSRGGPV